MDKTGLLPIMDIHSTEDFSSLSEVVVSNKRKRRSSTEDIENKRPAKRQYSPPEIQESDYVSDTQSSSDCYSTTVEYDIDQMESPPASVNILSPLEYSTKSWMTKGDTTPSSNKQKNVAWKQKALALPTIKERTCPLPSFSWAESNDVWKMMCKKDAKASQERDPYMFQNHPGLQPRMRAILLDWLIEVCEVYKLHRETYYLAVDYLDRFLSSSSLKVTKSHLQLIGITCLFIAAKVEEIYPPKIGEFAYVTDSACTEEDIITQELILLKALNWCISPVTAIGWLSVYMQINATTRETAVVKIPKAIKMAKLKNNLSNNNNNESSSSEIMDSFVYPQFSGMEFAQTAQLIDLCSLDCGLANFPYSVVAAAAVSHTFDKKTAIAVSGLDWDIIVPCTRWMEPFFQIICEEAQQLFLLESNDQIKVSYGLQHVCPNLVTDDSHILQTHSINLTMFENASARREQLLDAERALKYQEASPAQLVETVCPEGLLTPPASNRKSLELSNLESESDIQKTKTS